MRMSNEYKKKGPEILAPAGNFEGLLGCINAGCDAVYLGGRQFGARAYAENFSDEEIIKAIKYAHVFNVKIYLTINTLIKEREVKEAIDYVKPFAEAGLDAFIVQDLGLISLLKENFPNVEIHISTQAFSTGINSVKYFKELGASRVVLAREMTLHEIKNIKDNVNIELETFIHGAMCYSYSGQCLFSSSFGGRSGNRGRCAGPCRLCYSTNAGKIPHKEEFMLSMKDQCTVSILSKIIDAGVDSLKIEGRMKKPEYAAFVTSIYRKYTDQYLESGKLCVSKEDYENLLHIYLRSMIGTGYYECESSKDMITLSRPSYSGNDEHLMLDIKNKYLINPPKRKISGFFNATANECMSLSLFTGDKCVVVNGDYTERSLKRATTRDEVFKQINKLGDTPFEFDELTIEIEDNLFIPVSKLNELRRQAIKELLNEF